MNFDVLGAPQPPFPSAWKASNLKSICTKIGSGATPTGGQATYQEVRTNFALVRSQNVLDHEFSNSGLAFISDAQAENLKGAKLQVNDILLNITGDGATFGRSCLAPKSVLPACVNQHVCIIRLDPLLANPGYVVGYLSHPAVKSYIESFNAGGSRRAITKSHIESFVVPLPPLEIQVEIGLLLSDFNRRISLLRATNATLEAIAHALFKSWFVDFDPVRAKAEGKALEGMDEATAALFPSELEETRLGFIPKGWCIKRLSELLELVYGKALKATDRKPGTVPVYGSGGITGFHNEALVSHASVIVGRKGTVGSLYWEDKPFFPIDTTFYVKPIEVPLTYCYYAMQRLGLESMNTDAAVPGLNRENAYRLEVVVPSSTEMECFNSITMALRNSISANNQRSKILADLRDTLLPRLISGQLRLPQAQEEVEEALA